MLLLYERNGPPGAARQLSLSLGANYSFEKLMENL
jgi:hypothetical protein